MAERVPADATILPGSRSALFMNEKPLAVRRWLILGTPNAYAGTALRTGRETRPRWPNVSLLNLGRVIGLVRQRARKYPAFFAGYGLLAPVEQHLDQGLVQRHVVPGILIAPKEQDWLNTSLAAIQNRTSIQVIANGKMRDLIIEFLRLAEGQPV
jgi:hypothetical protein